MFFIVLGSSFIAEVLPSILITETCQTTFDSQYRVKIAQNVCKL